jgi:hypothetical protein
MVYFWLVLIGIFLVLILILPYRRKTWLVHFSVVNLAGTTFSLKGGGIGPLFDASQPPFWSHPLLYARIPRNHQKVCQLGALFPIPSLAFEGKHKVKEWKRVGGQEKVCQKSQE